MNLISRTSMLLFLALSTAFVQSCNKDQEEPNTPATPSTISFNIPEGYVRGNEKRWIVISDKDGNEIGYKKVDNSQKIEFEIPGKYPKEELFTYTEVLIYFLKEEVPYVYDLTSYTKIKAGEYGLPTPRTGREEVGLLEMRLFMEHVNSPRLRFVGNAIGGGYTSEGVNPQVYRLKMTENTSDLFVSLSNEDIDNSDPVYKYFPQINSGETVDVNYTDFKQFDKKTLMIEEGSDYLVTVRGYADKNNLNNSLTVSYTNSSAEDVESREAKLLYPGKIFPFYGTHFTRYNPSEEISYYIKSVEPFLGFKKIDASISALKQTDNTLELTTTGNYDYSIIKSDYDDQENFYYWWVYSEAAEKTTIKLPAIPAEIVNTYGKLATTKFVFDRASVTDSDAYQNYADFFSQYYVTGTTAKIGLESLTFGKSFEKDASGQRKTVGSRKISKRNMIEL